MQLLDRLIVLSKKSPARIVVCEAHDPRILTAAYQAQEQGVAKMILVGPQAPIQETAAQLKLDISALTIEDPALSEKKARISPTIGKSVRIRACQLKRPIPLSMTLSTSPLC